MGKRAIGDGAFQFILWVVKAFWLVAKKMELKDVI